MSPRCCHLILLLPILILTGCFGSPRTPNLPETKRQVAQYVLSGDYEADVRTKVREGLDYLADYRAGPRTPAIVLDVDDTAITTWEYQKAMQFGFYYPALQAWRAEADAAAIEPVLTLYKYARDNGITVFFVTGRRERDREVTALNLERAGYDAYEELIMKPNDYDNDSVMGFKTASRARIESLGFRILLNVGDQESDLVGGFAERTIKLPNPFYLVQ